MLRFSLCLAAAAATTAQDDGLGPGRGPWELATPESQVTRSLSDSLTL